MENLIFVSTYAIGNEFGFGVGEFFDLSKFVDAQDFGNAAYEFAVELQKAHGIKNYKDVELAFPDHDCHPLIARFISESRVEDCVWDALKDSEADLNIIDAYIDAAGVMNEYNELKEEALENYAGCYACDVDYAWEFIDSTGYLNDLPSIIENNIDMEAVARDLMLDMLEANGHYFYAH